jgi:hypothetical protein
MDRILFGDNQFFGINHMSDEKARAQAMRFQDTRSILEVLEAAYAEGIRVFMCTTHERVADICDHFRSNAARFPGFEFYPCMPYAHKYADAVTEHGVLEALRQFLPADGALGALMRGGLSAAKKDIDGIAQLLIDAEMKMFAGLRTPVIFLQNVVSDLLLGLGFKDAFRVFADHVRLKYQAEPGFITMNLPLMAETLREVGLENPIICSNINKIGFRMCGGVPAYEALLRENRVRAIAMSVFASGAIPPRAAIEYACGLPGVQSIVFGASSRANIRETAGLIRECWERSATPAIEKGARHAAPADAG